MNPSLARLLLAVVLGFIAGGLFTFAAIMDQYTFTRRKSGGGA
jgi:hypothetical protein